MTILRLWHFFQEKLSFYEKGDLAQELSLLKEKNELLEDEINSWRMKTSKADSKIEFLSKEGES